MSLNSLINRNNYIGNNATSSYSYTFKILKKQDLSVIVREISSGQESILSEGDDFTVSGVKNVSGGSISLVNDGQAWLSSGSLSSNYTITLIRTRELKQLTDIKNQGDFYPEIHEDAFDGFVMNDQYLQDQISRSAKLPTSIDPALFNMDIPANLVGSANRSFITNDDGDGWELGPTADEIANAQIYAQAAEAAQTAAENAQNAAEAAQAGSELAEDGSQAAEINAAASAAAAAASAVSAANNASASNWNDVIYKVFADSPVSIVQADSGKLFSIDCTGGNVVVNLPLISDLDLSGPWSVGFVKTDQTDNKIIINRSGSDVISPSASSYEIIVYNQGAVLIPDTDPSPDKWEVLKYGAMDFLNSQMFSELVSDPIAPPSGNLKVFAKSGKFYQRDSSGKVSRLGGGSGGGGGIRWQSGQVKGAILDTDISTNYTDYFVFNPSELETVSGVYKVPKSHETGAQKRMIVQVLAGTTSISGKKFKFEAVVSLAKEGVYGLNTRTVSVEVGPITVAGGYVLYNLDFDITSTTGQINSVDVVANDALYITIQRVAASSVELDDIVFLLPDNTEVYDA